MADESDRDEAMRQQIRDYLALPDEEQLKQNSFYKSRYESAYAFFDRPVPTPWEELTHEQRDSVRQETIRYQRELDEFGKSLRGE